MKKILFLSLFLICLSSPAFAAYYQILNAQTANGNSSAFKGSIPYYGAYPTLHITGTQGAATIALQGKNPITGTWETSATDDINSTGFHTIIYNPEVSLRVNISGADGSTNLSAIVYGAVAD